MKNSITFDIGTTVHGETILLIKEMDGTYTIKKEALSQRSQTDIIRGIPKEAVANMVHAMAFEVKK